MQVSSYRKRYSFLIASCMAVSLLLSSCGVKNETSKTQDMKPQTEQVDSSTGSSDSSTVKDSTAPGDPESKVIASIPERNIYMYGLDNGVELRVGDLVQQYDWIYNTPRGIEPRLAVKDYDGDGHNELAVILYVGSGTGVSLEELHMIEMEEDPKLQDRQFMENDYLDQVNPAISFKPIKEAEELIAEVKVGSKKTEVIMKKYYDHDEFGAVRKQLGIRDVVGFSFDDNNDIKARFGVPFLFEKIASPQYFGDLNADVSYHDGQFTLSNFEFIAEENL
ncbi:hypothetical protein H8B09_12850 [Paenibacillus sp. PR3]|uniref:Lipoprotein n=1 Tax=Paenibacillus terricola TaxID=2763503 RepID=A0ABR8MVN4_9BACL|nr:hypothetical protein [Paenibacillus terricola]MBD3919645.1 hypothetical protein [Paenibacillus terricola]